jgi:hypothetical protein
MYVRHRGNKKGHLLAIAMMRTPDGHGRIELSRFLTPAAVADHRNAPVNALGYLYRLCYVRGPEGILIGLAEQIG